MSAQHTKGRIYAAEARTEGYCLVPYSSGVDVVVCSEDEYGHYGPIKNKADAERLAACWNALEDMSTDDIEAVTRVAETANAFLRKALSDREQLAAARALLTELIDTEGPQPGTAAWADKVRTFLKGEKA